MSRFDRYMLGQLMTLFGFFALVLVGVYWVNRAVALFDQLISDGQSAWVFLEFTALSLPTVIRMLLPVAALVGTVYVTNRLSAESELSVMQATGFSPFRLARPVLYFGLIVALMVSALSHFLEPAARRQLAERRGEIAANVTSRLLVEGSFVHPASGITLYIREITPLGELRDILLVDTRETERQTTYVAERAALVRGDTGPKLVMFDGMAQSVTRPDNRLAVTRFADFAYDIGALIGDPVARPPRADELGTPALLAADPATVEAARSNRATFLYEAHDRFVQAGLAIILPLIGFAALMNGGFSRFGLWRQIAVAVGLVIGIQLLGNAASRLAITSDALWPAVYLPVVAGITVGLALLGWAGRSRRIRAAAPAGAPA